MIIGITGGIASGKSTVSRMLADLGAVVIDADRMAREVVEPGEPALAEIEKRFGSVVIQEDGRLNRTKLAELIFKDEQARLDLNAITHPAIRQKMIEKKKAAVQAGESLIVLDIPLLFENELEYMVDKVLVVYVPHPIQRKRLMERDQIEADQAEQKINSQISLERKKEKGDAYIDNSGSLEATRAQLRDILEEWLTER